MKKPLQTMPARHTLLMLLGGCMALGAAVPMALFFRLLSSGAMITSQVVIVKLVLPHSIFLAGLGIALAGVILKVRQYYLSSRMGHQNDTAA